MPVNVATRSVTQPIPSVGAQPMRSAAPVGQGLWQNIPLEGVQPSSGIFMAGTTTVSGSGIGFHSMDSGNGLHRGQIQSSSFEGAQPSFDASNTGHGFKHGQSYSHPSAKPHPLQHLVDIHNAGPVSAFSRDPASFTGTTPIHCIPHLLSLEGHPPSGGSASGPVVQSNASCRPLGAGCLLCSSDRHSRLTPSGVTGVGLGGLIPDADAGRSGMRRVWIFLYPSTSLGFGLLCITATHFFYCSSGRCSQ